MKKTILTFCLAMMAALAIHAETYTGEIVVTGLGQTNTETVDVNVTEQSNGLNTLVLHAPFNGRLLTMTMTDVPSATVDNITTYSAVRDVQTGTIYGTMKTTMFARVTDGMMAANVAIPAYGVTMWFNTVGDHFQLPNSDMESWTNSLGEPDRWHGFKSATGFLASFSPALLEQSEDIHSGANGQYSALVTAKSAGISIANGTMTSGRLNAASMDATSTSNHASSDRSYGDDYYMPLYAQPDQFKVWLKYTQETANASNKANVSVKTFDGSYYQEPEDKQYTNLSGSIVGGQIDACDWTQFTFPIDYASYAANNAVTNAIFVTFSTNPNPGQGNSNDRLFIDDIQLVYLAEMTDLRYQGATISGWNPAVTAYAIETQGVPNLDDFTADLTGASAVVTKTMEQNADGTYRIAISAVAGDLQSATCYVITATVTEPQGMLGDVDGDGVIGIADVTALIDYILSGDESSIILGNADVDGDCSINIADVTTLIDYILSGHF